MRRLFSIVFLFLFLLPTFAHADIIISEVAWMGTTNSHNDEWIELYNDGGEPVTLNDWRLEASDGSPTIPLSGAIATGGFFLLERTDDETIPDVTADVIYTGALNNVGETLRLINATGAAHTSVPADGGWPGGDNSTKETMQWDGAAWITGSPTPRAAALAPSLPESVTPESEPEERTIIAPPHISTPSVSPPPIVTRVVTDVADAIESAPQPVVQEAGEKEIEPVIPPQPPADEEALYKEIQQTLEEARRTVRNIEENVLSLEAKRHEIVQDEMPLYSPIAAKDLALEAGKATQTGLVIDASEPLTVKKPQGFLDFVLSIPTKIFEFFKGLFSGDGS